MTGSRRFEFEVGTTWSDAMRTVVAALDDEGLVISEGGQHPLARITSVIVDRKLVLVVPAFRITPKEIAA